MNSKEHRARKVYFGWNKWEAVRAQVVFLLKVIRRSIPKEALWSNRCRRHALSVWF